MNLKQAISEHAVDGWAPAGDYAVQKGNLCICVAATRGRAHFSLSDGDVLVMGSFDAAECKAAAERRLTH